MMKHGHAKRVINSCPSCVSPFYSLSARPTERERENHLGRDSSRFDSRDASERVFNKRGFFSMIEASFIRDV